MTRLSFATDVLQRSRDLYSSGNKAGCPSDISFFTSDYLEYLVFNVAIGSSLTRINNAFLTNISVQAKFGNLKRVEAVTSKYGGAEVLAYLLEYTGKFKDRPLFMLGCDKCRDCYPFFAVKSDAFHGCDHQPVDPVAANALGILPLNQPRQRFEQPFDEYKRSRLAKQLGIPAPSATEKFESDHLKRRERKRLRDRVLQEKDLSIPVAVDPMYDAVRAKVA